MKLMLKLAAMAVLAGCTAPDLPEAQRIDGIDWILTEVNGLPWQGDASLHLEGDRLTGVGPCNAYSGRREGTAPAFAVTGLGATALACADPARTQAEAVADVARELAAGVAGEDLKAVLDHRSKTPVVD